MNTKQSDSGRNKLTEDVIVQSAPVAHVLVKYYVFSKAEVMSIFAARDS